MTPTSLQVSPSRPPHLDDHHTTDPTRWPPVPPSHPLPVPSSPPLPLYPSAVPRSPPPFDAPAPSSTTMMTAGGSLRSLALMYTGSVRTPCFARRADEKLMGFGNRVRRECRAVADIPVQTTDPRRLCDRFRHGRQSVALLSLPPLSLTHSRPSQRLSGHRRLESRLGAKSRSNQAWTYFRNRRSIPSTFRSTPRECAWPASLLHVRC